MSLHVVMYIVHVLIKYRFDFIYATTGFLAFFAELNAFHSFRQLPKVIFVSHIQEHCHIYTIYSTFIFIAQFLKIVLFLCPIKL